MARRRKRRKKLGPKFRRRRRRSRIPRAFRMVGLPKVFRTSLPYALTTVLNPGAAGATATYTLRTNSLFDPDVTGAGHQPRYFDSLNIQYLQYRVVGSIITVKASNFDAASPQIFGIEMSKQAAAQTSALALLEDPDVRTVQLSPSTGGSNTKTVRKGWSLQRAVGRLAKGDQDYSANTTSSPSAQWYFHLFAFPVDASKDAGTINVTVQIMYRCIFYNAILPPQSN